MHNSLEEHINAIVEEKIESLLPKIIEKINKGFEVKRKEHFLIRKK